MHAEEDGFYPIFQQLRREESYFQLLRLDGWRLLKALIKHVWKSPPFLVPVSVSQQNVYYTSSQQLHLGVLSPTIDDDDNKCLVDVNSRPRLLECSYAATKHMKLTWTFTQVNHTQTKDHSCTCTMQSLQPNPPCTTKTSSCDILPISDRLSWAFDLTGLLIGFLYVAITSCCFLSAGPKLCEFRAVFPIHWHKICATSSPLCLRLKEAPLLFF